MASIGAFAIPISASATTTPAHHPHHTASVEYDVSLGDSLSVGAQPNARGFDVPTNQGYANDLYAQLKREEARNGRTLKLVELGCIGETSTTMIKGGICTYRGAKSQLAAAENFLSAHRGHVAVVTLSIGANDVDQCVTTTINLPCIEQGLLALEGNLPTITAGLRHADPGTATTFAGLNFYDPFLADWLTGSQGQAAATESVELLGVLNTLMKDEYSPAGFHIADVADAFKVTQFTPTVELPGFGQVPLNVDLTCKLTWMCAPAPVGPDIHPNAAGYKLIARAFSQVISIRRD
jgi:lysophospholipase L1-like esterase